MKNLYRILTYVIQKKRSRRMLSAGRSKHWSSTFKELTGQEEMDGAAVTEYFKPLYEWLVKKNRKTGAYVGWTSEFSTNVNVRC